MVELDVMLVLFNKFLKKNFVYRNLIYSGIIFPEIYVLLRIIRNCQICKFLFKVQMLHSLIFRRGFQNVPNNLLFDRWSP